MKRYKKWVMVGLALSTVGFLAGCGNQFKYNPQWKFYSATTGVKWQVNQDHYITDSNTSFQWTIYTATKSRTPDFTNYTGGTTWKQLSSEQAKRQLGILWRLVPKGHFYFYRFEVPSTEWDMAPSTRVGVGTSQNNNEDKNRLVKDIIYTSLTGPLIFLTTVPLQLTSIATNHSEQSITYTWEPLS